MNQYPSHSNNRGSGSKKWAKVRQPRSIESNHHDNAFGLSPDELRIEESYLRTKSYHSLSTFLDRVWMETLQQHSVARDVVNILQRQFAADEELRTKTTCTSNDEVQERDSEDRGLKELDDTVTSSLPDEIRTNLSELMFANSSTPPVSSRQALQLPVLVLDGPYHRLDRHEWMKVLVDTTKSQSQSSKSVVWLREATGMNLCWPQEVTRQILLQIEKGTISRGDRKRKRQHNHKGAFTEILTTAFSSGCLENLVVFVEAPHTSIITQPKFQDFLQWLCDCRALYGLAVQLVVLQGPSVDDNRLALLQLRSTSYGPVGLRVQSVSLPSSQGILEAFFDRLFIGDDQLAHRFPLAIEANEIRRRILTRFYDEHHSVVMAILDLKRTIAMYHVNAGSFLLSANCLPREERNRLAWFILQPDARCSVHGKLKSRHAIEEWLDQLTIARVLYGFGLQIEQLMKKFDDGGNSAAERHDNEHHLCPNDYPLTRGTSKSSSALDHDDKKQILVLLAGLRKRCKDQTLPAFLGFNGHRRELDSSRLIRCLNELIIVVDNCISMDEIKRSIKSLLEEWHIVASSHHADQQSQEKALATLYNQPRRHTIAGLLKGAATLTSTPAEDFGVKLEFLLNDLYRLILRDRVSISQSEWFTLFHHKIVPQLERQEAYSLFVCGVSHLKIAGLIRERKRMGVCKNDSIYDKTALVWCGGD